MRVAQILLAQRPVYTDLVPSGVDAEVAAGEIDVVQRPAVRRDGQFRGGYNEGRDSPHRANCSLHRDEYDRLTPLLLVLLAVEQATTGLVRRSRWPATFACSSSSAPRHQASTSARSPTARMPMAGCSATMRSSTSETTSCIAVRVSRPANRHRPETPEWTVYER